MQYHVDFYELTIFFTGDVSSNNASQVEEDSFKITNSNSFKSLVLNFKDLRYISSAGLRVVLKLKQTYKDVFLFAFLSTIGLGINELIMFIGSDKFNINYLIVKIFATGIVMVYNFITRKLFIEKK